MADKVAFESNVQNIPGFSAGEDLSDYQYHAVKLSSGLVVKCDTAGEVPLGMLQDAPSASGIACTVAYGGIGKAAVGGTVSQLERLVVDTDAELIAQTSPDQAVVAKALSDGSDGEVIPVIYINGSADKSSLANTKIWIGDAAGAAAAFAISGDGTMTAGGVLTITDVTVGSDATGDVQYKASATAMGRLGIGNGGDKLTVNPGGTAPAWDNGKIVKATLAAMTAADDPVIAEFDHTVAPGTTGAHCYAVLPDGTKLGYWVLGAGQTILGPVGGAAGIDIGCDQTENEGLELFTGWGGADGKPMAVGFDAAFYMLIKINMANVSGVDDLFVGFKAEELYNADMEAYDTYFGLGINSSADPADLEVRNELNGGGADNTATTDTIADGIDLQIKVLVAANGVATILHDATTPGTLAAPTATKAFTFDDGDQLLPTCRYLHAAAPVGGVILVKDWEVGPQ